MIYKVTAIAIFPDGTTSPARMEEINTETEELFRGARGEWDVEDRYEHFWNRLNDSWEHNFPAGKEKVKVVSVEAA